MMYTPNNLHFGNLTLSSASHIPTPATLLMHHKHTHSHKNVDVNKPTTLVHSTNYGAITNNVLEIQEKITYTWNRVQ